MARRPGQFEPGDKRGYAFKIADLKENDPEGYERHLTERRIKQGLKRKVAAVVNAHSTELTAVIFNKALELLANGGAAEFIAVYDRFIGKPDSQVDVTSNGQTMAAPSIVFVANELDDWKDASDSSNDDFK